MRILLFCENKYAIDILLPLQEQADAEGGHEVLWYVHRPKIPAFPLAADVRWTHSMQEAYDFRPDAVFVPGNIVPYYLSGVKVQVFHGYASEKKGHWIIRRYFDTYFTQGPHFTRRFEELARRYGDFEVLETGWPRQDWKFRNLHHFDAERERLLSESGCGRIVLYAPTFSPKLTSLPYMKQALVDLVEKRNALVLMKFHPLTAPEWVTEYKALAARTPNLVWVDDYSLAKQIFLSDMMVSDTSSAVYESLLLDKPVITLNALARDIYWTDVADASQLLAAYDEVVARDPMRERRRWIIDNYDPYLDGQCARRMFDGVRDYICRHGVPERRKLNLWRKYTSIKTFGRVKKGG